MDTRVFCGSAFRGLGQAVANALGLPLGRCLQERYPDGEWHVQLEEDVCDAEVVLVQSLADPAGERLLELLLLADACQHAGAARLTAVLPYIAYARQDRRIHEGDPVGGPLMARLVTSGGFSRILAVDLHSPAAEGWFGAVLEHLSAARPLADAVRSLLAPGTVVVSPDLGGAKRAERVAQLLGLPLAIVHKERRNGERVAIHGVLGDVRERPVLLVDDLISTGGTLQSAVGALRGAGCADDVTVVATHALLVGEAVERLQSARIRRLVHTDSLPGAAALPFERHVVSLAPLIASALHPRRARAGTTPTAR